MPPQTISSIILAGGKARRMRGLDKGLQTYRGRRLIEHAIESISPQVDEILISANRYLDEYASLGYAVYPDKHDRFDGPLAGIASAIPHCKHDWILVIPCDMPFLPGDLVSKMKQYTNQAKLVAISNEGRLQLIFLLHRSLIDSIKLYLTGNQHTVMHWLDTVDHHVLAIDNENHFYNINTFEQINS